MLRPMIGVVMVAALVAVVITSLLGGLPDDAALRASVLDLRFWRAGCAALAGAALAVAGVLVQGLFRNPLASPSVLGTSAGAALGGQIVLAAHAALIGILPAWIAAEAVLPLGCLVGAGLALAAVLAIAGRTRDGVALLLAGVILATFLAGFAALITALSQESWQIGRALIAFSLGGVDGKGARHLALAAPLVVVGIAIAWTWSRELDLLLSGSTEAAALGVDVRGATTWILVWTAVLVGAAVAVAGGVAFVGLIVPHVVRGLVGHAHGRLIPAAAIVGAGFVVACDLIVRHLPGGDLPLGVVTALVGAPVFLALLLRLRREGWLA